MPLVSLPWSLNRSSKDEGKKRDPAINRKSARTECNHDIVIVEMMRRPPCPVYFEISLLFEPDMVTLCYFTAF